MNCPKCTASMDVITFGGVDVDRCTACGGIWFDSREKESLKAMEGSQQIDTGDPAVGRKNNQIRRVPCARCSTPMVRMVDPQQPHIWYESCSVCGGVYFDAGEFRDYKEHTLSDFFRDLFARPRG
ncbi:zf-TFIIB domain-containing protein [Sorangium sp. So ce590]|uniref:zf-TFIIB domain-containing protein n=1 Tax=unclassified Sorangium TaxID=2621164 RepID=UPI003F62190A